MISRQGAALVGIAALAGLGFGTARASATWTCPAGYRVHAGLNLDFPSDGEKRAFIVYPPDDLSRPAPVWVPLTGSVESTRANLTIPRSGANSLMAKQGFMVIGPVRACAKENPDLAAGACNGPGHDGWSWNPWREGRAPTPAGDRFKSDEGPDSRFLVAMVRCVGTTYKLDRRRLYLGGISSGGTMTNRALTFRSDFWAGGMPISGEWYVTRDDGSSMPFDGARAYVAANPTKVFQGRAVPFPVRKRLGPLIVITVWGGNNDNWRCDGVHLCSDYRPTTQAASNYYSSLTDVVSIACTASDGHMWPQANTQAFNRWALTTLASHPKGSDPKAFRLNPPPEGYSCKLGPFTDHYPAPTS